MSSQMTPQEFAEMILNKMIEYCREKYNYIPLYIKCIATYSPDKLEDFIKKRLKRFKKVWENADDKFRELVKKEYEKLWNEDVAVKVGDHLSALLFDLRIMIEEDADLPIDQKAELLERCKNFLDEFDDVVAEALSKQEPLSPDELRKYFLKLCKTLDYLCDADNFDYPDINYYSKFNEAGKLKILSLLLDEIDKTIHDIEVFLEEYYELLEEEEEEEEELEE